MLLPFTALCRALPWFRWVRAAHERVALLVEMRADDRARELHAEAPLAGALRRFAAAGHRITPAGALGIGDRDLDVGCSGCWSRPAAPAARGRRAGGDDHAGRPADRPVPALTAAAADRALPTAALPDPATRLDRLRSAPPIALCQPDRPVLRLLRCVLIGRMLRVECYDKRDYV